MKQLETYSTGNPQSYPQLLGITSSQYKHQRLTTIWKIYAGATSQCQNGCHNNQSLEINPSQRIMQIEFKLHVVNW